jgi:hypothetical protein
MMFKSINKDGKIYLEGEINYRLLILYDDGLYLFREKNMKMRSHTTMFIFVYFSNHPKMRLIDIRY